MNYDFIPDRPIAFNRDFVDLGIGITGALLLSQAIYWSKRTKDTQGWFYKTADEWQEETGMTRNEQETARKKLRELGILEEKRAGLPAKLYYRINAYKLGELLTSRLAKSDNQDSHNVPNITIQRVHSEITTESTTKSKAQNKFAPPTPEEIASFIKDRNLDVSVESFYLHYESNGWMVGKVKMKSWKHTVLKWHNTNQNRRIK